MYDYRGFSRLDIRWIRFIFTFTFTLFSSIVGSHQGHFLNPPPSLSTSRLSPTVLAKNRGIWFRFAFHCLQPLSGDCSRLISMLFFLFFYYCFGFAVILLFFVSDGDIYVYYYVFVVWYCWEVEKRSLHMVALKMIVCCVNFLNIMTVHELIILWFICFSFFLVYLWR